MSEIARAWHYRAEELRAQADDTLDPTAKRTPLDLADHWERMSEGREGILRLGGGIPEDWPRAAVKRA